MAGMSVLLEGDTHGYSGNPAVRNYQSKITRHMSAKRSNESKLELLFLKKLGTFKPPPSK